MTSRALRLKWETVCLVLFLICRMSWQAEESPMSRGLSKTLNNMILERHDESHIMTLIKKAYDKHELLKPEQWTQENNEEMMTRKSPIQRDIPNYQDISASPISRLEQEAKRTIRGRRRLLEHHAQSSTGTFAQTDGKIIFPMDYDMTHHSRRSNQNSVPVCEGSTFCETVASYPKQLINEAIQRNTSLKFLENIDVVPEITQRINVLDETVLCASSERVIYPQAAENKNKQWLFIVNQDELKQGIRIDVCSDEGQKCKVIDNFSEGYQTTCKQKFIYRQLAAVGNNDDIVTDVFSFPSSCCCHVKFTGNPRLRTGLTDEESNTAPENQKQK